MRPPIRDLLTVSRLKTARSCLQRHHFEFQRRYRPIRDSHPLRFGTFIHRALETLARGKPLDWPAHADGLDMDAVDHVKAQELVRGYLHHWGAFCDVLEVEALFECALPSPDLESDHPTFRLGGKMDLLLGTRERTIVLDHKTSGESLAPESPLWGRLALDSQISQYFIGAESLGFHAVEWIHDVIRKPEIDPLKATPPEKRKFTKDGRLYANQRAEDETLDDFQHRLQDDIASRPEFYFARKSIVRLDSQIAAHLTDLWDWAALLSSRARNPDACHRYGVCPFFVCCSSGSSPEDHPSLFRMVEDLHPELAVEV